MEVLTQIITNEALQTELEFVLGFFKSQSKTNTCAMLGVGCNIPGDKMFEEIMMSKNQLRKFVEDKIAQYVFHLGDDDLILYDKLLDAEFTFCHEHDLHFKSNDHALVESMLARWSTMGYNHYEVKQK
jgi:hypothetical protein